MSFGSKRLDDAYDRWATQSPDEYYGEDEEIEQTAQELIDEAKIEYTEQELADKNISKICKKQKNHTHTSERKKK